jgi:hypothetical protein
MKKTLLIFGILLASTSINAQTLVNGNWEAAMTQIPGFVNVYSTTGWSGFNFSPESTGPYEGLQSAKLTTTSDAALNTALSWGDDVISGVVQQIYRGPIANPEDVVMSFGYKFTKTGQDTAYVQVVIYDTLAAGASDDKALYFDFLELGASVANWTTATFTMNPTGETGTANRMVILGVSSVKGVFDLQTPSAGTTLWLDGFSIGSANIEENTISSKVYPNPAENNLNVEMTEELVSVNVISLDGKIVVSQVMNGSTSVDVANLNSGAYVLEATTVSGAVVRTNFIKK